MGNTRNTGYLQNIVLYDENDNITLPARLAVTGTVAINNTTPYDTTQFSLDVNGGLIVKNINKTAQFVLINANPATGGNNAFVVHTVGGTSASSYADIQGYYGTSIAGSTVLRLNPQGGNVLVGSLAGTGSRMVVASATGVLSTQAIVTLGDLSGVPTSRTITINGTTFDLSANRSFTINSMVYPGAGIAVSTGTAWGTSLTDNSGNWNTAYGWGNHAGLYSLLNHTHTFASLTSKPTTLAGYGITDAATSAQGTNADTAYGWGNHASGGYVTLTGTQTISGVKTFSTYQLMDVAILIKHGSNTSTGGYTGIGSVAAGLTINLGIGTTASLLFNTSASYSYTFPAASGTIALTSDIPSLANYVTLNTVQTITANKTFSEFGFFDKGVLLKQNFYPSASGYNGIGAISGGFYFSIGQTTVQTLLFNSTTPYQYTFPSTTGTIALTSDLSTYATQTYVGTQIANLVASSPAALDTLNELAAALGNDAAFSTTVSTALGNRLRVDINTQGLSATLQGYGRTNLGLGTAATSNTGDFAAASHTHSIANVTGLQTALDGKQASGSYAAATHSHIISDVTGLQTALDGKQASLGFTPYNSTNPSGYISSYTETDTLATVTGRGASTSSALTLNGNVRFTAGTSDSAYTRIEYPAGGTYITQASSVTGAIRIKLPTQGSAMMMTCTVKVYEYTTNKSFAITFGGHRDGNNWYNEFCYLDGDNARGELTVRFGVDGGKDCVYIGETGTVWSYPQVFVTDAQLGYAGYGASWLTGWEVAFVTAFSTVNRTQTAYRKLTPANYNSYAPTLAGTGASGTWGISITGNAATVASRSVGNSASNVAYYDTNGNLYINNPESYSGEVRLGAAWGRGGIYAANGLSLSTNGSFIDFVFGNVVPATMNTSGAITFNNHNTGGIRLVSSGTGSEGAAFGMQQVTGEGWTGIFVDFEPYTGWGLYHDNPNNYFCVTAEASTGSLRSFTVPSRVSGNRTAHEKIRFDQAAGSILAGGDITAFSDGRVKTDVNVIDDAINKIKSIRGVTFKRSDSEGDAKDIKHAGVIAQEVLTVLPEVVHQDHNTGMYSVAYGNMAALFIEAIKEQQTQIESQKSEIDELKDLVQQLINR